MCRPHRDHRAHPAAQVRGVPRQRRQGQPLHIIALADRAQDRLWRRRARMAARGKPHNKIVVAIARELVGYIWAALHPGAATTGA